MRGREAREIKIGNINKACRKEAIKEKQENRIMRRRKPRKMKMRNINKIRRKETIRREAGKEQDYAAEEGSKESKNGE